MILAKVKIEKLALLRHRCRATGRGWSAGQCNISRVYRILAAAPKFHVREICACAANFSPFRNATSKFTNSRRSERFAFGGIREFTRSNILPFYSLSWRILQIGRIYLQLRAVVSLNFSSKLIIDGQYRVAPLRWVKQKTQKNKKKHSTGWRLRAERNRKEFLREGKQIKNQAADIFLFSEFSVRNRILVGGGG